MGIKAEKQFNEIKPLLNISDEKKVFFNDYHIKDFLETLEKFRELDIVKNCNWDLYPWFEVYCKGVRIIDKNAFKHKTQKFGDTDIIASADTPEALTMWMRGQITLYNAIKKQMIKYPELKFEEW